MRCVIGSGVISGGIIGSGIVRIIIGGQVQAAAAVPRVTALQSRGGKVIDNLQVNNLF